MSDKRRYPRYACKIKVKFDYYEGNPDNIDIDISVPHKAKGRILDISRVGVFMVSNQRVAVNMPVRIFFSTKKQKYSIQGRIVRTGRLENNPTELAKKFLKFSSKGEIYIAVEFNEQIDISENDIK
ncbi:MAG: PilZ domain-containing protein [Spirochaetes bacterium]|jgi:hypothetical protein|nr:PilZ domain-containing protein [Spirochaetota bacterium]